MVELLLFLIRIAQQITEQCTGEHATAMSPVVDSRNQKPEDANAYSPATDLTENVLPINATTTFSVIEQGSDETADSSRSPDSKLHPGKGGDEKTHDAANSIEDYHPVCAEFLDNQRCQLVKGKHVETDMQESAVQIVGSYQGPPSMQLKYRDGTGRSKNQKTLIARGKEIKGTEIETSKPWINDERKDKHNDISGDNRCNQLVTVGDPGNKDIIF